MTLILIAVHLHTGQQRIELGKPASAVFSYVNPVPLASASVAPVHEAGEASSVMACSCM